MQRTGIRVMNTSDVRTEEQLALLTAAARSINGTLHDVSADCRCQFHALCHQLQRLTKWVLYAVGRWRSLC